MGFFHFKGSFKYNSKDECHKTISLKFDRVPFVLHGRIGNCSPSFHLTFALLDFPGAGKELIIKSRNLLSSRNLTSKIILIILITFDVILPGNCLHI